MKTTTVQTVARVLATDTADCIPWEHGLNGRGQGLLCVEGKLRNAHQVIARTKLGPPPPMGSYRLAMTCGAEFKDCINWRHMEWGQRRHARIGSPKLDELDVKAIRMLVAEGTRQTEIASLFNIGQSTISKIVSRALWPDVS